MSEADDNIFTKNYEAKVARQLMEEPARDLLFDIHKALLHAAEPTRIVNRLILFTLVVVRLAFVNSSIRWNLALMSTALVVAAYWYLNDFLVRRNIDRLEEHITETYTSRLAAVSRSPETISLPESVPNSSDAYKSSVGSDTCSTGALAEKDASLIKRVEETWINAYINWRHERWKSATFERARLLEPVAWFILLLVLCIGGILIR